MEKESVIKHSAAVQITNRINLLQRRAWNVLLANAYDELPDKKVHQLSIKDLMKMLGLEKSENMVYIKKILIDLMSCVVEWNVLGKDGKNIWEAYSLLAESKIEKGILTYSYGPMLSERLYNPAMYARISLSMQNKFDSKHSLALYELCVDYFIAKRKYGVTPFISIEKFRKLMGLKAHEYSEFKILNKWVIKEPLKEINKKSDLLVEPEYKRESRKIVALKFHIRLHPENKNPLLLQELDINPMIPLKEEIAESGKKKKPLQNPVVSNPELYQILREDFRLSGSQAEDVLNNYEESYISEKLAYVREQHKNGKIKNIGAYTLKAIQEDFRIRESKLDQKKEEEDKKKLLAAKKRKIEDGFELSYHVYKTNIAEKYKQTLSETELEKIEADIWEQVREERKGKKLGLKGFFYGALNNYLAKQGNALSYEDWKKEEMKKYPELFEE